MHRLRELVRRKSCTKRELLSLLGFLQHAARVKKTWSFIRTKTIPPSYHNPQAHKCHLRINTEFRSDLEWWFQLAAEWNGISILAPLRAESPDRLITSDASGSWGCGAFHEGKWFQLQWDHFSSPHHITIKELLPIVIGAALWGQQWSGKTIQARGDNMAAVHILHSRQSKAPEAMHLVRCLCLIECTFNFTLVSRHLPGVIG